MTIIPDLRSELVRVAAREGEQRDAAPARRRVLGLPLVVVASLTLVAGATAAGLVVSEATKQKSAQLTQDTTLSSARPGNAAAVGSDLERQAEAIKTRLPYPPGMRDSFNASGHDTAATLGAGAETERETSLVLEYRAACLWRVYFLASVDAGDEAAQRDALSVLRQVPDWPATRGLPSERQMQQQHAENAAAGDLAAMRTDAAINCKDVK